ncbi:MAG: diacylglycerol/lipid kinase family protein [Thiohalocapsa sp.]
MPDRKAALDELIRRERRAVLVVNTRARRGRQLYRAAKALLVRQGMRLDATYPVRNPERLPEIVRDAVAQGHRLIVVGGGDGTISTVVDQLADRPAVLGVLPLGTANSFARTLGIPLNLEGAAQLLTGGGKIADVDLGKIDGDCFANSAAIGYPALVARRVPNMLKRTVGRAAFVLVGAAQLFSHQPFRCTLSRNGSQIAAFDDALQILIANGGYHGGVLIAPAADVESRDLVVSVVSGSRANLLKLWLRAGSGAAAGAVQTIFRAADIVIETDPRQYVSIDGEPVTQTPVRATLARQALLVMVPPDYRQRRDRE